MSEGNAVEKDNFSKLDADINFRKNDAYAWYVTIYYKLFRICKTCREIPRILTLSGTSTITTIFKMELVLAIVINGWQPWTFDTKNPISHVVAVLDLPPYIQSFWKEFFKLTESNFSIVFCGWMFSQNFPRNFFACLDSLSQTSTIHGTSRGRGRPFLTPL